MSYTQKGGNKEDRGGGELRINVEQKIEQNNATSS